MTYYRHGHSTSGRKGRQTPEYGAWLQLRGRCRNPNHKNYAYYGGRGITVCVRWEVSFENFLTDMGPRPGPGYSVERRDNDGPYAAWNCIWATKSEQSRNTRRNHLIEISGARVCLTAAAEAAGLHPSTVRHRLKKGWEPTHALTTPARRRCRSTTPTPSAELRSA